MPNRAFIDWRLVDIMRFLNQWVSGGKSVVPLSSWGTFQRQKKRSLGFGIHGGLPPGLRFERHWAGLFLKIQPNKKALMAGRLITQTLKTFH